MAGYPAKPLKEKLGIKEGMKLQIISPPDGYFDWIEMPTIKSSKSKTGFDFIHAFFISRAALNKSIVVLKASLKREGMLWISWPKKSSKTETDIDEHFVRHALLHAGLVDVKVCAVSETWSGLKFVYRLKDR